MADPQFVVKEVDFADSPSFIEVIFSNQAGERRAVNLPRPNIPQLLLRLQSKIEDKSVIPINQASFQPGANFALDGFQAKLNPDGSAELLLFVRLPDQNGRGVTIPLGLTPEDILSLGRMLGLGQT